MLAPSISSIRRRVRAALLKHPARRELSAPASPAKSAERAAASYIIKKCLLVSVDIGGQGRRKARWLARRPAKKSSDEAPLRPIANSRA